MCNNIVVSHTKGPSFVEVNVISYFILVTLVFCFVLFYVCIQYLCVCMYAFDCADTPCTYATKCILSKNSRPIYGWRAYDERRVHFSNNSPLLMNCSIKVHQSNCYCIVWDGNQQLKRKILCKCFLSRQPFPCWARFIESGSHMYCHATKSKQICLLYDCQ